MQRGTKTAYAGAGRAAGFGLNSLSKASIFSVPPSWTPRLTANPSISTPGVRSEPATERM